MSVMIITKNESLAIGRCVRSVAPYFEQVVVLDSNSSDDTAELAREAGAEVVTFDWDGKYPKKKQWGLENTDLRHQWVLILDGDEYATPELIDEIRRRAGKEQGFVAYDVPLDYTFLGKTLKHGHKIFKRIVFDRTRAAFPVLDDLGVPNPFEMELHVQPIPLNEGDRMATFASKLGHDDLEPLAHYFDRHNRYSDWEAHLRNVQETATRTKQGELWAKIPLKPLAFFFYCYVARRGFLDGRAGLHYALSQSFYYWQIGLKARELRRTGSLSVG
jgi:glycosyltransferase involved in cell wall biosynthesis